MKNKISVFLAACLFLIADNAGAQKPSPKLLTPSNHTLVLIDHEGQMAFATKSITTEELRNNVAIISQAAKLFKVPVVLTTVHEKTFSGPLFPEILEAFPGITPIDRSTMNTWEDVNANKAITSKGKKKIVLAGLWTEVCIVGPALSALNEGYEVYVITDACGGVTNESHERAVQRIIQAGGQPLTAMQYLLELQRDWDRMDTAGPVLEIAQKYGGAYGLGIQYANGMLKPHK